MTYLFIHGSFGSPREAWFPWLKYELELLHHKVIAPQFPTDLWSSVSSLSAETYLPTQSLMSWTETFDEVVNNISPQQQVCVVGHSLGPLFTLNMIDKYGLILQNAYFVAPFLHPASKEELKDPSAALIHKANLSFYYHNYDFERLRIHIPRSTVIYSNDDPNVHEWEALEFAEKLGSKTKRLIGLGHMGIESNLKEFPELLKIIKNNVS